MSDVWEEYFAGPVPPAEGGVNWEAYSHDELYQMLWQDADVADVSTVATEWAKHRAALATHAEVLREQCVALRDSWQGAGAEEAVSRLERLAARVEKISELAHAGGQAAQEAADALATARAMMPPPPGNPGAPLTNAMAAVPSTAPDPAALFVPPAPASPSMSSLNSYMSSMQSYLASMQSSMQSSLSSSLPTAFAPTTTTASPTTASAAPSDMGTAFGAVSGGGFSFYAGGATEDQQKAQAVRAMRTYESSLTSSSQMLGAARGAVPAAAPAPTHAAESAQSGTGVPWQRLVGAAPAGGLRGGAGAVTRVPGSTAGPGSPGGSGAVRHVPLGLGARVGALPGIGGVPGMTAAQLAETAAARAAAQGAMVPPPVGGQRSAAADDEQHENRLPRLDQGLFAVDVPPIVEVIGLTGEQR